MEREIITDQNVNSLPPEFKAAFKSSQSLNLHMGALLQENEEVMAELETNDAGLEERLQAKVTPYILRGILANQIMMDALNQIVYSEYLHLVDQGILSPDVTYEEFAGQNFNTAANSLLDTANMCLGLLNEKLQEMTQEQAVATLSCMAKLVTDQGQVSWYRAATGQTGKESEPEAVEAEMLDESQVPEALKESKRSHLKLVPDAEEVEVVEEA